MNYTEKLLVNILSDFNQYNKAGKPRRRYTYKLKVPQVSGRRFGKLLRDLAKAVQLTKDEDLFAECDQILDDNGKVQLLARKIKLTRKCAEG